MRIEIGEDLWEYLYADVWIVIPTNTTVTRAKKAVMGAGLAKQAATRWPDLPVRYGERLLKSDYIPHVFKDERIILFPTKYNWKNKADLGLITEMAMLLQNYRDSGLLEDHVFLPALGCGLGGLSISEVQPLLESILDDSFTMVLK